MTELIARAKRGDPDAFTELMMGQMQNMYKVARSILSHEEDALLFVKSYAEEGTQITEDNFYVVPVE